MTTDAATPLTHLAGQWLGSFQLISLIGVGAMGAVYLARDSVLQREVAIKLIAKGSADTDPARRDRFLREARAAARLIHPNVVQTFQVGEDVYVRFIAMEYVHGMTTAQAAKHYGGRLPEQFGIEKMREAAAALQIAASFGISHRDVKPANLLLNQAGILKITDFGLASHPDSSGTLGPASGTLEGTPFYMSPEQWAGAEVGPQSDIYSLGCTFYHLLVGRTPYAARDLAGCYRAHVQSAIPDPKAFMPEIDPLLAELLRRCMAKRAHERPSAGQIVELLDDMLMLRRSAVRTRSPGRESQGEVPLELSATRPSSPATAGPQSTYSSVGSVQITNANVGSISGVTPLPGGQFTTQHSYRAQFGLTGYPFSDIRQPSNFWDAGPYAWVLRTLASQILAGQMPTTLVGGPGTGKTFICEMLKNKIPKLRTFPIEPQLLFGTRIMVALCRQIGATAVTPDAPQRFLIDMFLAQALQREAPDTVAVAVIDGVDPNDHELVREIEDIVRSAPMGRFSMILVGDAELPATLASNGAAPELYLSAQPLLLPGMTLQEMLDYIDFRMRAVGGASRSIELDIASQQLLHARSGGSPKLINIYCHNALTMVALRQENNVSLSSLRLGMKSKSYLTSEAALALLESKA